MQTADLNVAVLAPCRPASVVVVGDPPPESSSVDDPPTESSASSQRTCTRRKRSSKSTATESSVSSDPIRIRRKRTTTRIAPSCGGRSLSAEQKVGALPLPECAVEGRELPLPSDQRALVRIMHRMQDRIEILEELVTKHAGELSTLLPAGPTAIKRDPGQFNAAHASIKPATLGATATMGAQSADVLLESVVLEPKAPAAATRPVIHNLQRNVLTRSVSDAIEAMDSVVSSGASDLLQNNVLTQSVSGAMGVMDNVMETVISSGAADLPPLVQLLTNSGVCGKLLAFFGGVYFFNSRPKNVVYVTCWVSSFMVCAGLCFMNVVVCAAPYHNVPSDLLTAYVHVPVFIAWRLWRRELHNDHFRRGLRIPLGALNDLQGQRLRFWMRIILYCVFLAMLGTSILVVAAYAVPPTITSVEYFQRDSRGPSRRNRPTMDTGKTSAPADSEDAYRIDFCLRTPRAIAAVAESKIGSNMTGNPWGLLDLPSKSIFQLVHAIAMYLVIPPVICVLLGVYTMLLLVFAIHAIDFHRLNSFINGSLTRMQMKMLRGAEECGDLVFQIRKQKDGAGVEYEALSSVTDDLIEGSIMLTLASGRRSWDECSVRTRTNISANRIRIQNTAPFTNNGGIEPALGTKSASKVLGAARCLRRLNTSRRNIHAITSTEARNESSASSSTNAASVQQVHTAALLAARTDSCNFSDTVELIMRAASERQARLDATCKLVSGPYLHLVIFNSIQLIMICINLEGHGPNGDTSHLQYTWYWPLGDAFHVIVGLLFTTVMLASYAAMTQYAQSVIGHAEDRMEALHICRERRSILTVTMTQVIHGTHIVDVSITKEFVVMFLWAVLLAITTSGLAMLQTL